MARPTHEEVELLRGDPDDFDPEDLARMLAYRMMPRWGQVLAWVLWELPAPLYGVLGGGLLWLTYTPSIAWKAAVIGFVFVAALAWTARRRAANPYRTYVLVSRKPVSDRDLEAAADAARAR